MATVVVGLQYVRVLNQHLYILNFHNILWQLYLNKTQGRRHSWSQGMSLFPCPHILTMNTFFSEEKGVCGYYVQNIVLSTLWIILFHSQSTLRKKIVSRFANKEAETMQNLCKWLRF